MSDFFFKLGVIMIKIIMRLALAIVIIIGLFTIISLSGSARMYYFSMIMILPVGLLISPIVASTIFENRRWHGIIWHICFWSFLVFFGGLFLFMMKSEVKDLPYAINKEYMYVTGNATKVCWVYSGGGGLSPTKITINTDEYKYYSFSKKEAIEGKTYTLKYLPHSKNIMEIIGPLD